MLFNVSLVTWCFVFLLTDNSHCLVSAADVFDCSARDPCQATYFNHSIFKYPHANESQVVNCLVSEDGYLGCVITSCRIGYIFDSEKRTCIPPTYDCGDNGGNPCSPLAIEGKTVYAHHDMAKKVQCVNGICEVKPCPLGGIVPTYYYDDLAQRCLTIVNRCDQHECTADNKNKIYLGFALFYGITCYNDRCKDVFRCRRNQYIGFNQYGHMSCISHSTYCLTGTYFFEGECFICPEGTKSTRDPNTRLFCDLCRLGTYQPNKGQSSCIDCEPGTFADSTGLVTCTECPMGTFQDYPEQGHCLPCSLGYFQDEPGQVACKPCAVGTFAGKVGSHMCEQCQHATLPGQATCDILP